MNAAPVLTALFNGAWQGALLCAAALLALRALRRSNATTMFAIWSVLLGICIALPFVNYAFAARPYTVHTAPAQIIARASTYVVTGVPYVAELPRPVQAPENIIVTSGPVLAQRTPKQRALDVLTAIMARSWMLLVLLALVAAARLAVLARDLVAMMRARAAARRIEAPVRARLRIDRPYAFATSSTLTSPCVLGFSPALIVIPEELLGSPSDELLSVILHEAEHVRRFDDVQNVVHRAIWAVGFFCPGIRIALRQLALYREQICDDAAVDGMGDAVTYARTLSGLAQWAQGRGVPVPSLIFKRKHLLRRLEVLLDGAVNHSLRINRRSAFAAAIATVLCAFIVVRVQVPVIAQVASPAPNIAAARASVRAAQAQAKLAAHAAAQAQLHAKAVAAQIARAAKAMKAARNAAVLSATKAQAAARAARAAALAGAAKARASARAAKAAARNALRANVNVMRSTQTAARTSAAYAYAYQVDQRSNYAHSTSDSLLDALEAANLHDLSVNDLISLRDHGVSPQLVDAAHRFFGSRLTPAYLVQFADHGVSPQYLDSLASAGLTNISHEDVVRLMEHGVDAHFIARIRAYNPRATVDDIIHLRDSGF